MLQVKRRKSKRRKAKGEKAKGEKGKGEKAIAQEQGGEIPGGARANEKVTPLKQKTDGDKAPDRPSE